MTRPQKTLYKSTGVITKYSKYKNVKVYFDGKKFDSKKEKKCYVMLRTMQDNGKIQDLKTQVKFILQPSYKFNGKTIRAIEYVADFTYIEKGQMHIVDTKGYRTDVYKLKKKLFEYKYGIEIEEV